jgi:hypothetical protein
LVLPITCARCGPLCSFVSPGMPFARLHLPEDGRRQNRAGNEIGDGNVDLDRGREARLGLAEANGTMMVCDYNGWNDAPEEEREALDLLEATLTQPSLALVRMSPPGRSPTPAVDPGPHRRAA